MIEIFRRQNKAKTLKSSLYLVFPDLGKKRSLAPKNFDSGSYDQ
ncbi:MULTISPECIES: hypothetical protein [Acaryochloris]|nr:MULTISPECIES: hypothetical protein [Acaryochloris]